MGLKLCLLRLRNDVAAAKFLLVKVFAFLKNSATCELKYL